MACKVLICSGGTGGHIYPAQVLAKELKLKQQANILFVGGGLKKNPWFDQSEFQCQEITCAPFSIKNPFTWFRASCKIIKGVIESYLIIKRFQPKLVVAFGSFHTLPVLLAARLLRQKIVVHEQNKQMGRVNRLFAKRAHAIMVSFPKTIPEYPQSAWVQMPLKFQRGQSIDKDVLLKSISLQPGQKTILICGGSQGAVSINQKFLKTLPHLHNFSFQVIHLTGYNDSSSDIEKIYKNNQIAAYVKPFSRDIHQFMQISDFMISRAGASSVAELIELSLPAILIPYPYAANHQEYNADFVQNVVQGGVSLPERFMTSELLAKTVSHFFNETNLVEYRKQIEQYRQNATQEQCVEFIARQLG